MKIIPPCSVTALKNADAVQTDSKKTATTKSCSISGLTKNLSAPIGVPPTVLNMNKNPVTELQALQLIAEELNRLNNNFEWLAKKLEAAANSLEEETMS